MSSRQIDLKEVPGIDVIRDRLASFDPGLSVSAAGYDFDRTIYVLELSGQGREGRVRFSREFLDDVRDNRTPPGSRYSQELHAKLTDALREVIESNGLISFSEKALKYKLLQFIYKESKEREHVEKYNTIGRDAPGDFERWLRVTLTKEEKETLIWIWGDLLRLRLITPTGKDLVVPDNWVRVTDKGIAAIEGKSYVEYDEVQLNPRDPVATPIVARMDELFAVDAEARRRVIGLTGRHALRQARAKSLLDDIRSKIEAARAARWKTALRSS